MKYIIPLFLIGLIFVASGCGYTTSSLLPEGMDSIHVDNFVNKIDPSMEVSDRRATYSYRPGLEISITRAVIDGFIFDRHLDPVSEKDAALLLEGELTDLRQFPLSFDKGDSVDAMRVEVIVNLKLYDNKTGKIMWVENGFMGQHSYSLSGPNAETEAEAIKEAVKDLAQRIVERTVEAW